MGSTRRTERAVTTRQALGIVLAAFMLSMFAWTQTCEARAKHVFEIGPELSYIQYKEPDIMDEKGKW